MAGRLEGWRILVIDGDDQVREVLTEALEIEGARVRAADRAATGLAGLTKGTIDAVVSDADLADASGEVFYVALCARDPALAERTLFLARDPHAPAVRLLRTLTVVLPKPIALAELVAALVGLRA
jgi:DNA-binding response OmpR family regulator